MDIRQLKTFRTIADTGSFTKAAQLLGYTQSTISSQIKQLENTLGAPVFIYEHRHLNLTMTGQRLLPLTEHLLHDFQAIEALTTTTHLTGNLRIAAPESLTVYQLAPLIRKFRQQYPDIQLQLTNATCRFNQQQLMAGEADIALMLWPQLTTTTLIDHDLGPVAMSLVTSPDNDADFIINEPDCSYRNQFENYLWEACQLRPTIMELWSIAAIKPMVSSNLGYSYLPTMSVQAELTKKTLRSVAIPLDNQIHAHLLTRKSQAQQPLIAAFTTMALTMFN